MYRAFESELVDALFDDPHARRMAGELGETIAREIPHGGSMAWAVIVRTAVMDEMIMDCLGSGATGVLNLGAGLDTCAFRLKLPAALRWFDVDLPAMVARRPSNEAAASPSFQFAPRDNVRFFEPLGCREMTFRSTLDEAVRLRRSPPMAEWWSAFVAPWWPGVREMAQRMSGVVLMEAARTSTRRAASHAALEARP